MTDGGDHSHWDKYGTWEVGGVSEQIPARPRTHANGDQYQPFHASIIRGCEAISHGQ